MLLPNDCAWRACALQFGRGARAFPMLPLEDGRGCNTPAECAALAAAIESCRTSWAGEGSWPQANPDCACAPHLAWGGGTAAAYDGLASVPAQYRRMLIY